MNTIIEEDIFPLEYIVIEDFIIIDCNVENKENVLHSLLKSF